MNTNTPSRNPLLDISPDQLIARGRHLRNQMVKEFLRISIAYLKSSGRQCINRPLSGARCA